MPLWCSTVRQNPCERRGGCGLVFSGPGRTADDLIRKQVETARSRKGLCVVSSDNGVYGYARKAVVWRR